MTKIALIWAKQQTKSLKSVRFCLSKERMICYWIKQHFQSRERQIQRVLYCNPWAVLSSSGLNRARSARCSISAVTCCPLLWCTSNALCNRKKLHRFLNIPWNPVPTFVSWSGNFVCCFAQNYAILVGFSWFSMNLNLSYIKTFHGSKTIPHKMAKCDGHFLIKFS